uniref:LOB domain-containing protein n=1 Tax=Physcomitrium patens TaxID=3218 RepID=A0A2K1IAH9_PHYPA|nr:hypothetical protein PHYPA_030854 [Physcomitrium patens]
MSCNGCRVLRKGCSETCILRPCLQWIENMEAKGYATVFVAKFFGRAGLMGFISAMPEHQLMACGRTMNPMFVAVGLLWSGNWHVCQAAVNTVLKGGSLSLLSLSICLLENLSLSAPCFPAIAKNGGLPFSSTVRVDGPTQMVFPLSLNASEDNPFGRHTISLGIGFPEAGGEESKERTRSNFERITLDKSSTIRTKKVCTYKGCAWLPGESGPELKQYQWHLQPTVKCRMMNSQCLQMKPSSSS